MMSWWLPGNYTHKHSSHWAAKTLCKFSGNFYEEVFLTWDDWASRCLGRPRGPEFTERAAQSKKSRDLKRASWIFSRAHAWKDTTQSWRKNHLKGLVETVPRLHVGLAFPPTRKENLVVHMAWGRVFQKASLQWWDKIRIRWLLGHSKSLEASLKKIKQFPNLIESQNKAQGYL